MTLGVSLPSTNLNWTYRPDWTYYPTYQFPSYPWPGYQWPVQCPTCGHCPTCGNGRGIGWTVTTTGTADGTNITAAGTLDLNTSTSNVAIYNGATPAENECGFGDACSHD